MCSYIIVNKNDGFINLRKIRLRVHFISMKKNVIFIHIGSAKTATTSLQEFFYNNKQLLASKYKIYYPTTPGIKNHTNLAVYAAPKTTTDLRLRKGLNTPKAYAEFEQKFKKDFIQEINPCLKKGFSILLSNEHLSTRVNTKQAIQKLLRLFDFTDIQPILILYLRRQDQFLFSTYSTWVKSGGTKDFDINAYRKKRYDYEALINLWKSLGPKKIIVRPFEKQQWKEESIFSDFCSTIEIPLDPSFVIPSNNINKSLDRTQLRFLSLFNQHVPVFKDQKVNKLRGRVVQLLEATSTANKIKLSNDETEDILSYFAKTNSSLESEFNRGQKKSFFSIQNHSESTPTSNEIPELTVDEAVKIAAYLWEEQQKEIYRLKKNNLSEQSEKYKRGIKYIWQAFVLRLRGLLKN